MTGTSTPGSRPTGSSRTSGSWTPPTSVRRWRSPCTTARRSSPRAATEPRPGSGGPPTGPRTADRRPQTTPVSTFVDMLTQAREHIDVLVYAAVFLHEAYPRLNDVLRERAAEGCAVRIAVGDPDSTNVQERGKEERFGHGIESRCRLALMHYRPLAGVPGIEVRTHATTLYNSIYRADDQAMVNAHVWGVNAYAAPVWHLRRSGEGGMFDTYAGSFDAVWETATPVREG
ncbi:XRE family transcriptional regulator [Streptomyces sp. CB01580]|uniref:XRE family transcriptional regulator n=1 Tax=Streptomyces sp. CB01580 TaxID=1703933 RepID=UPI003FD0A3E1